MLAETDNGTILLEDTLPRDDCAVIVLKETLPVIFGNVGNLFDAISDAVELCHNL